MTCPSCWGKAGVWPDRFPKNFTLGRGRLLLLWPQAVRASDAIDTTINPNLLPPGNSLDGGLTYPVFTGGTSTSWAQGISAGLELRFESIRKQHLANPRHRGLARAVRSSRSCAPSASFRKENAAVNHGVSSSVSCLTARSLCRYSPLGDP